MESTLHAIANQVLQPENGGAHNLLPCAEETQSLTASGLLGSQMHQDLDSAASTAIESMQTSSLAPGEFAGEAALMAMQQEMERIGRAIEKGHATADQRIHWVYWRLKQVLAIVMEERQRGIDRHTEIMQLLQLFTPPPPPSVPLVNLNPYTRPIFHHPLHPTSPSAAPSVAAPLAVQESLDPLTTAPSSVSPPPLGQPDVPQPQMPPPQAPQSQVPLDASRPPPTAALFPSMSYPGIQSIAAQPGHLQAVDFEAISSSMAASLEGQGKGWGCFAKFTLFLLLLLFGGLTSVMVASDVGVSDGAGGKRELQQLNMTRVMATLKDTTSSTVNSWTATWRHYTTTNTTTITFTDNTTITTFNDNNTTTTDLMMDKEASPSFHFHVTGPSMDGSNITTVGPSDITATEEAGNAAATGVGAANASVDRAVEEVVKAEAGPMFNSSSTLPSTSFTTTEQHTDTILNTTTVTEERVPAFLPSEMEAGAMDEVKDGEQVAIRRHDGVTTSSATSTSFDTTKWVDATTTITEVPAVVEGKEAEVLEEATEAEKDGSTAPSISLDTTGEKIDTIVFTTTTSTTTTTTPAAGLADVAPGLIDPSLSSPAASPSFDSIEEVRSSGKGGEWAHAPPPHDHHGHLHKGLQLPFAHDTHVPSGGQLGGADDTCGEVVSKEAAGLHTYPPVHLQAHQDQLLPLPEETQQGHQEEGASEVMTPPVVQVQEEGAADAAAAEHEAATETRLAQDQAAQHDHTPHNGATITPDISTNPMGSTDDVECDASPVLHEGSGEADHSTPGTPSEDLNTSHNEEGQGPRGRGTQEEGGPEEPMEVEEPVVSIAEEPAERGVMVAEDQPLTFSAPSEPHHATAPSPTEGVGQEKNEQALMDAPPVSSTVVMDAPSVPSSDDKEKEGRAVDGHDVQDSSATPTADPEVETQHEQRQGGVGRVLAEASPAENSMTVAHPPRSEPFLPHPPQALSLAPAMALQPEGQRHEEGFLDDEEHGDHGGSHGAMEREEFDVEWALLEGMGLARQPADGSTGEGGEQELGHDQAQTGEGGELEGVKGGVPEEEAWDYSLEEKWEGEEEDEDRADGDEGEDEDHFEDDVEEEGQEEWEGEEWDEGSDAVEEEWIDEQDMGHAP